MDRVKATNAITASLFAAALMLGLHVSATAQDEGEFTPFDYVTGTVLSDSSPQEDWGQAWVDKGIVHVRDWRSERRIEWSDPRLPTVMVSRRNADTWLAQDDIAQMYAETIRLDGPDGAWSGTGSTFVIDHGQPADQLITLTGDGAYEGLSAMLVTEVVRSDPKAIDRVVFRGYIFEGPLPPLPEPVPPPV